MNLDAIDYLLCNFAGGADTEEFDDFSFDFSKKEHITHFIKKELTPFFTKNFSAEKKKELEELLDEVISKDISLEAHFNSSLYPFDFSSNEKFFFKELKALLYKKHL